MDQIDILLQLFRDTQEELKEKDIRIDDLTRRLNEQCIITAGKVDSKAFNDLSLKVERMTTRAMMISAIAGFIGSAIFITAIELIMSQLK